MPAKKKNLSKCEIERILSAGYSREEAARMLCVSPVTLRKAIRQYGIESKWRGRRVRDDLQEPVRVSADLQAWFDIEGEQLLRNFFRRLNSFQLVRKESRAK